MDPVFSFYLNREDDSSYGGEMVLGGVNPEYFDGDLEFMPTVHNSKWIIRMSSMTIKDKEFCKNCTAAIDTGTSSIVGGKEHVEKINSMLGTYYHFAGNYLVDCSRIDLLPSIKFIFHKMEYVLEPRHYVDKIDFWFGTLCSLPFEYHDSIEPNYWILGDVFMQRFYTVFDFGLKRIGLAYASNH
ncbi:unnamed protein product, partial [Schistosoma turkestanicum]